MSAAPSHPAPRQMQPVPTRPQQTAPSTHVQQPKQPGMFAQMATTAAGVAVGSAVVRFLPINQSPVVYQSDRTFYETIIFTFRVILSAMQ